LAKKECFRRLRQRFCGCFAARSWGETCTGRIAHRAIRLEWGETSMDISPHVHGAKRLWRIAHGAKCLVWGKTSMGRTVNGAKRLLITVLSVYRNVYDNTMQSAADSLVSCTQNKNNGMMINANYKN